MAAVNSGKNASQNRDRRAKFVELAESRTANAIRAIRVIAKLGNQSHYEFDEADVKKIAGALSREIESLKTRMLTRAASDSVDFRL